jgi:O-methyltransferase
MAEQNFCDLYPRFLETTETAPSRSRLDARWRAIIGWNKAVLAGRRVVDLGCHDGRWSFAALKAGAIHVTGIEARAHLVRKAEQNFSHYGVPADVYRFVTGDAVDTLRTLKAGSVDVVLCLGFFYHTLEHMRLLLEAKRLGAEYVIVDTSISPSAEPIVALASEAVDDTRNAVDYGAAGTGKALIGAPSKSGLLAMLDYAGYQAEFFDWQNNAVDDWSGMPDYAQHLRVTARARLRQAAPRVTSPPSARDLYVDLLIRSVVDGIYGEPMPGPWHVGNKFDRGERRPGTLGPTTAHTMVGVDRLNNVRDLTQAALDDGIAGDFIETGVWRGGCCILMRGILAAYGVGDRKVYVADSFQGVPPPKPDLYPADRDDTLYRHTELTVPLDVVKANFDRYGLLDDQVVFVEGFFCDTLPALQCGPLALLRLDGDLYESTDLALRHLYPKLSPGGFVIIDDYGVAPACRQAVHDYRAQHGIDAAIHTVDRSGVWWRKPAA